MNQRSKELAKRIVTYSTDVKPGERVLIELIDHGEALASELIKAVYDAGGEPFLQFRKEYILKALLEGCSEEQIKRMAEYEVRRMQDMQVYICVFGKYNPQELSSVPQEKMELYSKYYTKPLHGDVRIKNTKWCLAAWPTNALAESAGMSFEEFQDFFFKIANLDYTRMSRAMDGLIEVIENTDRVRIIGPSTDITFSIKGMPVVKCEGKRNIPDGEVYTAPVRESVNGVISYNIPSVFQDFQFEDVKFEFRDGKIVGAWANDTERINKILDADDGARYIGEFAFGLNPYLNKPVKTTIFDEKICGSIHITPGRALNKCDNGNRSAIHWDLVQIQTIEYGGGEVWFDDVLVRRNGVFVPEALQCLNPENLI